MESIIKDEQLDQVSGGEGRKPYGSVSAIESSPYAGPIKNYIAEAKKNGYPKDKVYSFAFNYGDMGRQCSREALIAFIDYHWATVSAARL